MLRFTQHDISGIVRIAADFVKMMALRMFLYRLENLSRPIADILIEIEKLRRELWTDALVFMLEENVGVIPGLCENPLLPIEQVRRSIVGAPKSQVAPVCRGYQIAVFTVLHLSQTQRAVALTETGEDLFIEPGDMAKFESDRPIRRQNRKKILQCQQIFSQRWRQLEKHRALTWTQRVFCAEEIFDFLAHPLETLDMCNFLRRLEDEAKTRRHLLGPMLQNAFFGQTVKCVVDLDRRQP